ncbi:MAG: hypothetical protein ACXWCM_12270 [Acidimicrobiales bacterium]
MAAPETESTTESTDVAEHPTRNPGRLVLRLGLALIVVLLVAMWAGIFLGFFDKTAPGTLDDDAFPKQAAPVCTATKAQLDALPKAFESPDNVARAKVVAESNTLLRAMIAQLATFAPTQDRDGRMTQEWLSDWSTYIGDREDYASRLGTDPSARFYETTKSSATEQISKPIDRFAYVNDMDPCDTPQDMS